MAFAEPVVLTGDLVLLEPLAAEHHDALVDAAADGQLWTLSYTGVPRPAEMRTQIEGYLARQQTGELVAFTVRERNTGTVVGQTTYCNVDASHRRLEVGGTWYARSAQRTGVNTETKLLLLTHAFDRLEAIAVELRTHWLNHQSRQAIERLGAKQDGVLRNHKIMPDGTFRDTVVFSILPHEWPAVRNELTRRLAAHEVTRTPGRHARPARRPARPS
ncbi:MAG: GNAT family protein [Mycobacteriaceae bacterium]